MTDKDNTGLNAVNTTIIRWGIGLIGMLVVAGAMSLANRDVYNKTQVNEKIVHERELSDQKDLALRQLITDQGETINSQLRTIREDQQAIKAILLKDGNR